MPSVIAGALQVLDLKHNSLFIIISQVSPGTTELVPASIDKRICVINYVLVMSAAGTVKFIDSDGDLTGAMPIVANGGISASGEATNCWFETGINKPLSIVTTGGMAFGHLSYILE